MTTKEDIKILLEKYFDGATSHKEELLLRDFFIREEIPEDLKHLKPLFIYLDSKTKTDIVSNKKEHKKLFYSIISGLAASLLITLSILGYDEYNEQNKNFVIINGEKISNVNIAKQQAEKALSDVSFSKEDVSESLFCTNIKEE